MNNRCRSSCVTQAVDKTRWSQANALDSKVNTTCQTCVGLAHRTRQYVQLDEQQTPRSGARTYLCVSNPRHTIPTVGPVAPEKARCTFTHCSRKRTLEARKPVHLKERVHHGGVRTIRTTSGRSRRVASRRPLHSWPRPHGRGWLSTAATPTSGNVSATVTGSRHHNVGNKGPSPAQRPAPAPTAQVTRAASRVATQTDRRGARQRKRYHTTLPSSHARVHQTRPTKAQAGLCRTER